MPSPGCRLKCSWSSRELREATMQPSSEFRSFQLDVGSLSLLPEFNDLPTTAGSTMEEMMMGDTFILPSGTGDQQAGSIHTTPLPRDFHTHPWWNAPTENLTVPMDSKPPSVNVPISGSHATQHQPPFLPSNNYKFDDTVMGAVRRFEAMQRRVPRSVTKEQDMASSDPSALCDPYPRTTAPCLSIPTGAPQK